MVKNISSEVILNPALLLNKYAVVDDLNYLCFGVLKYKMRNDITYLTGCGKDWVKTYVMWLDYSNIIRTVQVFAIIISSTSKNFYSMCYKYVSSQFAGEQ